MKRKKPKKGLWTRCSCGFEMVGFDELHKNGYFKFQRCPACGELLQVQIPRPPLFTTGG